MVKYANPSMSGLDRVASLGDGYSINMKWFQAYPEIFTNKIAYHLYYSTAELDVFKEGVKYVIIEGGCLSADIIDLTPGQDYWFSVRPVEYDPAVITFLPQLPRAYHSVRYYPTSMLRENISATDLVIPLLCTEGFTTPYGIVKIGIELIEYLAIDTVNNTLIVPPANSSGAHLELQSNGKYYLPGPNNIGQGSLASLTLVTDSAVDETWSIKCVESREDGYGNQVPARFEAIGSISGNPTDPNGNYYIWEANGPIVSNGILSFSVVETSPIFRPFIVDSSDFGDYFTVQTIGATSTPGGRGFNNTPITEHTVSGFDGYQCWSPIVSEFIFQEDSGWDQIYACQSRFEYPHFPFTVLEGYHQVAQDYLSTNDTAADAANVTFPEYDYAGYHRTDPVQLLNGTCVGSYIGGQMGCIDGYGNYSIYRGLSLENQNTQRQDVLLSVTGQPACLIRREQTGITCSCYLASSEYPDDRCPFCYGTKFVFGYTQYFNPRMSDGRIKIRLGPTAENLKMYEAGMESEFPVDMWTLTVPTIKTRDIIVTFDQDDNESFRYEVANVTRNNTILGLDGGQKMTTFRIRKTDPAYQIRIFRDTSDFPQTLTTSLAFAVGLPPHNHRVIRNEKAPSTWSQTTQVAQGHNHPIIIKNNLPVLMEVLGHTHQIIF
jgi:hypothetical protein